jgi:hypothetical protein
MASGLYIERRRDLHLRAWLVGLAVVAMLSFLGWTLLHWYTTGERPAFLPLPASALADSAVDETKLTLADINNYHVDATHPRYISIPALNLDKARVQTVDLTPNHTLALPHNISDTGWYDQSAYPGQGYGAVLIDGHNSGVERQGAFANLGKLKRDDEIIIERGDGKKFRYIVVENKTESIVSANTTGMKRLLTPYNETKEGLGIITSAGNWIPRDKVFDKRILIRAVAE